MTRATQPTTGAPAASTRSPSVVEVVWRERRLQKSRARKQTGNGNSGRRLTPEQYAKLQQLAVANTRELTGRDRF